MDNEHATFFGLRFQPFDEAASHGVAATHLVQTLEGFQRAIHLVAMMEAGCEIKQQVQVPRDIKGHFQLCCETASKGSYFLPTYLPEEKNSHLFSADQVRKVARTIKDFFGLINQADEQGLQNVVADPAYLRHLLGALEKMFPRQGAQHKLAVEGKSGKVILDGVQASKAISHFKKTPQPSVVFPVATGFLEQVDFEKRKLSLRIPSTRRLIRCDYGEAIEATLLENPRGLIQVVGTVEVDRAENPQKIAEVREVNPIDTSDIYVDDLLPQNLRAKKARHLRVKISLSEDQQAFFASLEELEISQAAYTRPDLVEALKDEMDFLWQEIALEKDEKLTPQAQNLKQSLLSYFEERPA